MNDPKPQLFRDETQYNSEAGLMGPSKPCNKITQRSLRLRQETVELIREVSEKTGWTRAELFEEMIPFYIRGHHLHGLPYATMGDPYFDPIRDLTGLMRVISDKMEEVINGEREFKEDLRLVSCALRLSRAQEIDPSYYSPTRK